MSNLSVQLITDRLFVKNINSFINTLSSDLTIYPKDIPTIILYIVESIDSKYYKYIDIDDDFEILIKTLLLTNNKILIENMDEIDNMISVVIKLMKFKNNLKIKKKRFFNL